MNEALRLWYNAAGRPTLTNATAVSVLILLYVYY
jgi:hypothetical protein